MSKKIHPKKLLVDTDAGVDDLCALFWLLKQKKYPVEILGISTVTGNSDTTLATKNVLALLALQNRISIPVLMGAEQPLQEKRSYTGALLHQTGHLWSQIKRKYLPAEPSKLSVSEFWLQVLDQNSVSLLTLGPLTNLAKAEKTTPGTLKKFSEIVCLGSSKFYGSRSPVAEYNFGQDPEAAEIVLNSGANLKLVPIEAHQSFRVNLEEFNANIDWKQSPMKLIYPIIENYFRINQQYFHTQRVPLPDVVAAILMLDPQLGQGQTAWVNIITESCLARGQTIVCLDFYEKLTSIASDRELSDLTKQAMEDSKFPLQKKLKEILCRSPDNVYYFIQSNEAKIKPTFFEAFRSSDETQSNHL